MNKRILNISKRSEDIINSQIASYRAIQNKSGVILSTISIFIPLFTFIPVSDVFWLEILKILSLIISGISCFLMITVLMHKKIRDGYSHDNFEEILNLSEKKYYEFEIGMALTNIDLNDEALVRINKIYNWGICLFLTSLITIIASYTINHSIIMAKQKKSEKKVIKKEIIKDKPTFKLKKIDPSLGRNIMGMEKSSGDKSKD